MSADNLDSLSDDQLIEAFAVEVAGFTFASHHRNAWKTRGQGIFTSPNKNSITIKWEKGNYGGSHLPPFATSADAVLPWLDKYDCFTITKHVTGFGYTVEIFQDGDSQPVGRHSGGSNAARTACIALIRMTRAQKGQA